MTTRRIEARAVLTAVDTTGRAFASVQNRIRGLNRSAEAFNRSQRGLDAAGRTLNERTTAVMGTVGRVGGVLAAGGLARGTARTVNDFAQLDRRMTRIAITADASVADQATALATMQRIATETALPFQQIETGIDAIVTAGRALPEAMAMIPAIARTAQASGSDVRDIALTAEAATGALRISADEMQRAFDIMVAAGKEGKFELKDMARYLPSLAPAAAAVGMSGLDGLRRLAATLQVVRAMTGSTEEAASSLSNIFAKMESEETANRFKKFGIDLRKEMTAARARGDDLLTTFVRLAEQATKGDLSKLPQLFSDMEFARGMRALLSQSGAVEKMVGQLNNVDGATMRDFNRVVGDTAGQIQRMRNAWDELWTALGQKASPVAVPVMKAVTDALNGAPLDTGPKGSVIVPGSTPVPASMPARARFPRDTGRDLRPSPEAQAEQDSLRAMASARAAERSVPRSDAVERFLVPAIIREQRAAARAGGGLTYGQLVAKEDGLRDRAELIRQAYQRQARPFIAAGLPVPEVEDRTFRDRMMRTTGPLMKAEAAREGRAAPGQAEIAAAIEAALAGIKAELGKPQPPLDVTGKVSIDPASKADVNVTIRVEGEGRVTGMSATSAGNIRANPGVSLGEFPGANP